MTLEQAEEIKTRIEVFNTLYSPIFLRFQTIHTNENTWAVTVTYNYTPDEWMQFSSLDYNYAQVIDKLDGYQFAMEAILAYQEECGNIKIQNLESK